MTRALAFAFLSLMPFTPALGDGAADVSSADRVEEDWEAVIASPDPEVTSPQIATSMRADPDEASPVCVFTLNYRDAPSFLAGGVQAKVRAGDRVLATSSQGSTQLGTADETVTWTQRLSLAGGNLNYKVTSGKSTTWGDFGSADDDLSVATATPLTSLAGYKPESSAEGSGPSFGATRVTRMTLLRVRYYRGQDLLASDDSPRQVHPAN